MSRIWEPGGYPIDLENRDEIAKLEDDSAVLSLVGSYDEVKFDPREVIQVESQRSQGACAGHSLSSILEWIRTILTGKTGLQLSRACGYYEAQRLDGIRGDKGSTISAGVRLAKEFGLPEERLWKYPSKYDTRRPRDWEAVKENASKYRIAKSIRITSYDGFRTFLGSGQGGIHNGIAWSSNVMSRPVVETYEPGGGGHSICSLCLSKRLDYQGNPFVWTLNSWDENWMQNGWQEWSPTAITQMLRSNRTSMVGLSDMPKAKPRKFSVEDWRRKLKA